MNHFSQKKVVTITQWHEQNICSNTHLYGNKHEQCAVICKSRGEL